MKPLLNIAAGDVLSRANQYVVLYMWRMEEQGLKNPQLSWFSGISARPGPVHKKLIGLNSKKKEIFCNKICKKT